MASIIALLMIGLFLAWPVPAAAQGYTIEFWADKTQIRPGECVPLYWDTENVREVYYNNQPVSGISQTRVECPAADTTYELLVVTRDGQQVRRQIYIDVVNQPLSPSYNWENWNNWTNNMFINFSADRSRIRAGECLNIYWDTRNVREVYYNNQPVSGIDQHRMECPVWNTTYDLLVISRDGQQIRRQIEVQVDQPAPWNPWENWNNSNMFINFWADRSHIRAGECVTIYWNTNNVREVYYEGSPVSGINQSRTECPDENTTYDLLVITHNNLQLQRQVRVDVSGGLAERDETRLTPGQMIDFDDEGQVSGNEDDFRWLWIENERGVIVKADDDRDLRLVSLDRGSEDSFEEVSKAECRDELDDEDDDQVNVREDSIVCFRSDDGNYGKFWVDDIGRTNGRLVLEWAIWE
jgi:hypothetical protein